MRIIPYYTKHADGSVLIEQLDANTMVKEAIDRLTFVFEGRTITAGASAGVSVLDTHSEAGRALEAADSAMYVRKALRRHEANS